MNFLFSTADIFFTVDIFVFPVYDFYRIICCIIFFLCWSVFFIIPYSDFYGVRFFYALQKFFLQCVFVVIFFRYTFYIYHFQR